MPPQPQAICSETPFLEGAIDGLEIRPLAQIADERGWLVELFRHDELDTGFHPAMAYLSATEPGVTRGPHEHIDQTDLFCFIGPGNFKLRVWDNRPASPTYWRVMTLFAGQDNPQMVIVPPGIVHAYRNISHFTGMTINCPNRLYAGPGHSEAVDEIRYEGDANTVFRLD